MDRISKIFSLKSLKCTIVSAFFSWGFVLLCVGAKLFIDVI